MNAYGESFSGRLNGVRGGYPSAAKEMLWADGLDGQEDELEDVKKGKLESPGDDEGTGAVVIRPNRDGIAETKEDEDDESIEKDLKSQG